MAKSCSTQGLAPRWSARVALFAAGAWLALTPAAARADDDAVVQAMRAGGVAVLLRHSHTPPGAGDPPGMKMSDCSTQRNLDAEGRAHARRVGAWFGERGIVPKVVRNSPWCRTRDTARLAFGRTRDWAPLANLFGSAEHADENAAEVRRYIASLRKGELAVLVSHGSSISAFVREYLAQGEAVVVRAERGATGEPAMIVVGRFTVR
jgi:phosphohistidine phosphatase SixA